MKSSEPPWFRQSKQLEYLLSGAWEEVSGVYLKEVLRAFGREDVPALEKLIDGVMSLGPEMNESIGDKAEAILRNVQTKAHSAWTLHGKDVTGLRRIKDYDGNYQEFLSHVHAEQIKRFAETNPRRILHPELVRQLDYLKQTDVARSIDFGQLNERLTRIASQERYWTNLSDVHVARLWHQDGLLLAQENGIQTCQIVGPYDEKTCVVCQRTFGTQVDVSRAVEKLKRDISITDPDEYVAAWTFPRIGDVDNISRDELRSKGLLPPFHPRCRHSISWLYKTDSTRVKPPRTRKPKPIVPTEPVPQTQEKEIAPGYVDRGAYLDLKYTDFKTKEDAEKWIKKNWSKEVNFGRASLDYINAMLGPLQRVTDVAPLKDKLNLLQIKSLRKNNGEFWYIRKNILMSSKIDSTVLTVEERAKKEIKKVTESISLRQKTLEQWENVKIPDPGPDANWKERFDYDMAVKRRDRMIENTKAAIEKAKSNLEFMEAGPVQRPRLGFNASALYDSQPGGTMVHEYGHAWHYENDEKVKDYFGQSVRNKSYPRLQEAIAKKYACSDYSRTNWAECFAENWTLYHLGEVKSMSPDMIKFFDREFPSLDFGHKLRPEIYKG